ncbi:MAG: PAS domain S-box protein [Anaerolineae bacterium]|nr:PAS domain S-box protein [Anaerolineae bacterium]
MKDSKKTKQQLIEDLKTMRARLAALERIETEHKQAEAALRESERRYRTLAATSPVGIFHANVQGDFTYVNEYWCRITGLLPEEALGQGWVQGIHPDDREHVIDVWHWATQEQSHFKVEYRFQHDDTTTWVLGQVTVERDEYGKSVGYVGTVTDITEHKRAEETIARLASFPEHNPNPIVELDLTGHVRYINPAARQLFPDLKIDTSNMQAAVSSHPWLPDWESMHTRLKKVKTGLLSREVMVGKAYYQQMMHQGDDYIRIYGHDITERKQIETSLLESEERFRHAIQEAPFPIMIHAEDGQIVTVNEIWSELTGYSHEDIPTISEWAKKAYGKRHDLVKTEISRLYKLDRRIKEGEYAITTSRGTMRMWDFSSAPLGTLPDGKQLVISMAMDVTDRKRMEEALLQHNDYLTALQETMFDLVSQLDLSSLLENIVKRAGQLMGTSSGYLDLVEPDTKQLKPHVGLGALADSLNNPVKPGEGIAGIVWQTGEPLVIDNYDTWPERVREFHYNTLRSVIGLPLLSGNQVLGVLGLAYDAASNQSFGQEAIELLRPLARLATIAIENAQLVEALRQSNAELQASNEELDAFGHTVAHDLKNPLGSIIGYAYLLTDKDSPLSPEDTYELAQNVEELSLRMDNIIEELMLLAGLRKADIEMAPLDMGNIVEEAQRRLAFMIRNTQAEIISPARWPQAIGYAPWVEEVWINYLSNAIKYGGQPLRVELGANQQGECVCFWVHDNGQGLTSEQQARLFKPFERLGQVCLKGHGLGLSIVQRIVERMDGQVSVESPGIPGKGSTFSFVLPANTGIGDQGLEGRE